MSDSQHWVAMGYIKGVFGVKGWLKIQPSTEYIDGLLDYAHWRLVKNDDIRLVELESGKAVGQELHVKFHTIDDRDQAALLRGYTIEISRQAFEPADENEFYWADLMGMSVVNRDAIELGVVAKLLETGAHDVLVLQGQWGEKLIPFVSQYIDDVDTEKRIINVDWGVDY